MVSKNNSAHIIEAYGAIRSELQSQLSGSGCKTFVVSSPSKSEGKTTTAINLAIAFSQLGRKVLLIDADLRNGTVHRKMKIPSSYGLCELLKNSIDFDKAAVAVNPSLDVITAGGRELSPESLLNGEAFDNLLSGLAFTYDYIIIDSPPVCETPDIMYIAKNTDGVALVIRKGITTYNKLNKAINTLKGLPVKYLGAIFIGNKND